MSCDLSSYSSSSSSSSSQPNATSSSDSDITNQKAIEAKSSALWECISRKQNETSGFSYTFKCRAEYDCSAFELEKLNAAIAKRIEIYPAVEPLPTHLAFLEPQFREATKENIEKIIHKIAKTTLYLNSPEDIERISKLTPSDLESEIKLFAPMIKSTRKNRIAYREKLQALGFVLKHKKDGTYLKTPDRETLIFRWNKLKEMNPELPALSIMSSDGIADDLTFIKAYISDNFLLSENKEFIHDIFLHGLPTLSKMLKGKYVIEIERLRALVSNCLCKIEAAKTEVAAGRLLLPSSEIPGEYDFAVLEAGLSAVVDVMNTLENTEIYTSTFEEKYLQTRTTWRNPALRTYFQKRFPDYVSPLIRYPNGAPLWNFIIKHSSEITDRI